MIKTDNRFRQYIIIFALITYYILVATRLSLFTIQHSKDSPKSGLHDAIPKRIDIVDKNNVLVATDIETRSFYLNKSLIDNPAQIAKQISNALHLDKVTIHKKIITKTKTNLILIKRHLTPEEELKIKKLGIAATIFEKDLLRFYPQNNLLSHIIGYTNIDREGMTGIEGYYNNYLSNPFNTPLKLTLDITLQAAIREASLKAIDKYKAKFVIAILSNVKTGDILAAVSVPDFNPNKIAESNPDNIFNKITYGLYEMGSVFKIFTIAAAFNHNLIKKDTLVDVSKPIEYGTFKIKDLSHIKKKILTAEEIFALSSNIGTVHISKMLGTKRQLNFFENLGLLEKVDTDLNEVAFPMQPRIWKEINAYTISYGYGLAVSPLNFVTAVNAILNNGTLITPRFTYNKSQNQKQITSHRTSKIIRELFKTTTIKGTGKLANINGYNVGGKSGTAEKISKHGKYDESLNKASFIAAFPIEDPQYSIFVLIDSGINPFSGKPGTGGSIAAPLTGDIIRSTIPLLNLEPRNQEI